MAESGGRSPGKRGSRSRSKDVGIQVGTLGKEPGERKDPGPCCGVSPWLLAGVVAVISVIITVPVYPVVENLFRKQGFHVPGDLMEDLGIEGIKIFKEHDRDNDGLLSIQEFEPLAHLLLDAKSEITYDETIEDWDEVVTIETLFQPLDLSTMSKTADEMMPLPGTLDPLSGLRNWLKPVQDWQNYGASHLRWFLPQDPYILESVGQTYDLIMLPGQDQYMKGATLSSNRYMPQQIHTPAEIMVHRLLKAFHPRPFVYSRFAPHGSVAIIRAVSDKYVDVMFRIHAEFQLNVAPFSPFWFTPAQFTGHAILNKDGTKVLFFHMYVPNDKRLNVDMEWLTNKQDDNMEVDIGYMAQMELRSTQDSTHVLGTAEDRAQHIPTSEEYLQLIQNIGWTDQITEREAKRLLEMKMYPFKQVEYYNFTDVYPKAREVDRPIHSILLWGALDDQSC